MRYQFVLESDHCVVRTRDFDYIRGLIEDYYASGQSFKIVATPIG